MLQYISVPLFDVEVLEDKLFNVALFNILPLDFALFNVALFTVAIFKAA